MVYIAGYILKFRWLVLRDGAVPDHVSTAIVVQLRDEIVVVSATELAIPW